MQDSLEWCWTSPTDLLPAWEFCQAEGEQTLEYVVDINFVDSPLYSRNADVYLSIVGNAGKTTEIQVASMLKGTKKNLVIYNEDIGSISSVFLRTNSYLDWRCQTINVRQGYRNWVIDCSGVLNKNTQSTVEYYSSGQETYDLVIKTSPTKKSGTKNSIEIELHGSLSNSGRKFLKQGLTTSSTFTTRIFSKHLGNIQGITLYNIGAFKDSWLCDYISIRSGDNDRYSIVIRSWIPPFSPKERSTTMQGKYFPVQSKTPSITLALSSAPIQIDCDTTVQDGELGLAYLPDVTRFVSVTCPSGCQKEDFAVVSGVSIHPSSSSICTSAILDGLISSSGGTLMVTITGHIIRYMSAVQNGLVSAEYQPRPFLNVLSFYTFAYKSMDLIESNVRVISDTNRLSTLGRLEVRINGVWGSVCRLGQNSESDRKKNNQSNFTQKNAIVACRSMGYPFGRVLPETCDNIDGMSVCGDSATPIHMGGVACTGEEESFLQCSYISPLSSLSSLSSASSPNGCSTHNDDVAIECSNTLLSASSPAEGTLRLMNSEGEESFDGIGRLEIFYSGSWGSVCNEKWTTSSANVACRELGFPGVKRRGGLNKKETCKNINGVDFCGMESLAINVSEVECEGTERSIRNCQIGIIRGKRLENIREIGELGEIGEVRYFYEENEIVDEIYCSHMEDVIIMCQENLDDEDEGKDGRGGKVDIDLPLLLPAKIQGSSFGMGAGDRDIAPLPCTASIENYVIPYLTQRDLQDVVQPGTWLIASCGENTCFDTAAPLEGSYVYTQRSSICLAAYHSGVLTVDDNSDSDQRYIVIIIGAKQSEYYGRTLNDITSVNYAGDSPLSLLISRPPVELLDSMVEPTGPNFLGSSRLSTSNSSSSSGKGGLTFLSQNEKSIGALDSLGVRSIEAVYNRLYDRSFIFSPEELSLLPLPTPYSPFFPSPQLFSPSLNTLGSPLFSYNSYPSQMQDSDNNYNPYPSKTLESIQQWITGESHDFIEANPSFSASVGKEKKLLKYIMEVNSETLFPEIEHNYPHMLLQALSLVPQTSENTFSALPAALFLQDSPSKKPVIHPTYLYIEGFGQVFPLAEQPVLGLQSEQFTVFIHFTLPHPTTNAPTPLPSAEYSLLKLGHCQGLDVIVSKERELLVGQLCSTIFYTTRDTRTLEYGETYLLGISYDHRERELELYLNGESVQKVKASFDRFVFPNLFEIEGREKRDERDEKGDNKMTVRVSTVLFYPFALFYREMKAVSDLVVSLRTRLPSNTGVTLKRYTKSGRKCTSPCLRSLPPVMYQLKEMKSFWDKSIPELEQYLEKIPEPAPLSPLSSTPTLSSTPSSTPLAMSPSEEETRSVLNYLKEGEQHIDKVSPSTGDKLLTLVGLNEKPKKVKSTQPLSPKDQAEKETLEEQIFTLTLQDKKLKKILQDIKSAPPALPTTASLLQGSLGVFKGLSPVAIPLDCFDHSSTHPILSKLPYGVSVRVHCHERCQIENLKGVKESKQGKDGVHSDVIPICAVSGISEQCHQEGNECKDGIVLDYISMKDDWKRRENAIEKENRELEDKLLLEERKEQILSGERSIWGGEEAQESLHLDIQHAQSHSFFFTNLRQIVKSQSEQKENTKTEERIDREQEKEDRFQNRITLYVERSQIGEEVFTDAFFSPITQKTWASKVQSRVKEVSVLRILWEILQSQTVFHLKKGVASWRSDCLTTAQSLLSKIRFGQHLLVVCPSLCMDAEEGAVLGDVSSGYHPSSLLCQAALHAGMPMGREFGVEMKLLGTAPLGGSRNGVLSKDSPPYSYYFNFLNAPQVEIEKLNEKASNLSKVQAMSLIPEDEKNSDEDSKRELEGKELLMEIERSPWKCREAFQSLGSTAPKENNSSVCYSLRDNSEKNCLDMDMFCFSCCLYSLQHTPYYYIENVGRTIISKPQLLLCEIQCQN